MHRRIVAVVSAVLFTLLALATLVVTDLHDRTYPQDLGVESVVNLDLARSELTDPEAFAALAEISDQHGLGLVKVAPDLRGDDAAQVYVRVGKEADVPATVERFGDAPPGEVRSAEALAHSYASGEYLVTGSLAGSGALDAWAAEHQVGARWNDNDLATTFRLVLRQPSFLVAMLAVSSLLVALVLYWLSAKARGRALRTLGGVPAGRVHLEDVGGFVAVTVAAATVVAAVAGLGVGVAYGPEFVPTYLRTLLVLFGSALAVATLGALVTSAVAWPSPDSLARRVSPLGHLRTVSIGLKVVSFAVVLMVVGPAVHSWADARTAAAQTAKWNALSDQVTLWFPSAMGEDGFQRLMGRVGDVVAEADEDSTVALSYAYAPEVLADVDLGKFDGVAIVNQQWLDLMAEPSAGGADVLAPVSPGSVGSELRTYVEGDLELWSRPGGPPVAGQTWYRVEEPGSLPFATGGSGELVFPEEALVVLVPDLDAAFNDSFLGSVATSRNLVFTGLGPTEELLARHGLKEELSVKYAAEEGILLAQFTAYFAWLQGVALVGLVLALALSAVISAFVVAVLRARRDHPLRLAGRTWPEILGQRVATECGLGLLLALVVVVLRGGQQPLVILGTAAALLALSPLAHLLASRWVFTRVIARRV